MIVVDGRAICTLPVAKSLVFLDVWASLSHVDDDQKALVRARPNDSHDRGQDSDRACDQNDP